MIAIVPLAGPDFVHPRLGIKPLFPIDGEPLLRRVITSRPWWRKGLLKSENLIFVLRDFPESDRALSYIDEWFPKSKKVIISDFTQGALMSVLAGVALVKDFEVPICIDLVDILYDSQEVMVDLFAKDSSVGAIVPYFISQESCYSYLEIGDRNSVTKAVEKQVISQFASAGTYFFRNVRSYINSVAFSLQHRQELSVKDILFVCPAINYVISVGARVIPIPVNNIRSISKIFHEEKI
jgi:hypothetical protein